jgi:uncharacterized protein (DUF2461 family)
MGFAGFPELALDFYEVRFSKDKTPYKTRQYAVVHQGDQGLYIGIDASGLHLGGGMFHTSSEQVVRLREAVAAEPSGSALQKLLATLKRKGFEIGGEQLKRYKSLTSYIDYQPAEWLHTATAKTRVVSAWQAVAPLNRWFATNVS